MKMQQRMVVFFILVLIVYTTFNFYIGWHLALWLDAARIAYEPAVYWPLFTLVAYGYIFGRIPLHRSLKPAGRLLKVAGSYYIFVFELGLLLILIADLGGWIIKLAGLNAAFYTLYAGAAVIAVLLFLLIIGSRNAWNPIVRKFVLEVDKPGIAAREWTIAVASDIHLGNVVGNRHLRRLVKRVNAMNPDLILLPGDVIDDTIEPFIRNNMSVTLGQLKAKHGVYAVLGNHEYYGGHIEQYVSEMNAIGIRVLRDETAEIAGSLYVAGRKDKTAEAADPEGRLSTETLLSGLDLSKLIVLMDHQPTGFGKAAEAGADLLLCGHTHRGQFAPNHWLTRRLFELDWGYMKKGAMHVIVSSGFGSWGPPIRIGSRSEIIQIQIKMKE